MVVVAHVTKFNKAACGHMFAHYDRQAEHISNDSIDKSKTHLNYNLASEQQPMSQGDFLRKRCSEVKLQNRKDVNVMCSWVVTVPKDVNETDYRLFFQGVYSFLTKRYGKENVISAWVHMDETTPHMHFAFIPVTVDKKKGGYKVSAKEVLTKHELQTFHSDLDKYICHYLGYSVSILNEATKEGNKTVLELQRQTAIKRKQVAEQAANAAEERLKALQGHVLTAEEVDRLNGKKTLTGAIRGISYEEYKNLKVTAARVEQAEKEKIAAEQAAQAIKSKAMVLLATAEVGAAEIIKKAKLEASRLSDRISKKERKIAELNAEKQKAEQAKITAEQKTSVAEQELQERLKEISLLQSYIEKLTSTVALAKKLVEEEQKQQDLPSRDVIKKNTEVIRQKQEQRQQSLPQQSPKKIGR